MRICMRFTVSLLAFIMIIPSVAYSDKAPKASTINKIMGQKKALPATRFHIRYKSAHEAADSELVSIHLNENQHEDTIEDPSKILHALQEKLDAFRNQNGSGKIEVSIMLRYDLQMTKKQFMNTAFAPLKDSITDENGLGAYIFFAKLTPDEIIEISQWDSISSLSIPEDVVSVW